MVLTDNLPAIPIVGPPKTLSVTYRDGKTVSMPYFCKEGAKRFLLTQSDAVSFRVKRY